MNIDTFDKIISGERARIRGIIAEEMDSFMRPEQERLIVEQYMQLSDEEKAAIPHSYRQRIEAIVKKLEAKYG